MWTESSSASSLNPSTYKHPCLPPLLQRDCECNAGTDKPRALARLLATTIFVHVGKQTLLLWLLPAALAAPCAHCERVTFFATCYDSSAAHGLGLTFWELRGVVLNATHSEWTWHMNDAPTTDAQDTYVLLNANHRVW